MTPKTFRARAGNGVRDPYRGRRELARPSITSSPRPTRGSAAFCSATIRLSSVHDLEDQFPEAELIGGDADFEQLVAKVVGFVEMPSIRTRRFLWISAAPPSSVESGKRCARYRPVRP